MTWTRREVLAGLGVGSAATLLSAFGCGSAPPPARSPVATADDVRGWLHDAVARLGPAAHGLAVLRSRTAVAVDVLGTGVSHAVYSGAVLSVAGKDGRRREAVVSELSAAAFAAAAASLGAGEAVEPGAVVAAAPVLRVDAAALRKVASQLMSAAPPSSRIVYAAALVEVDDALVTSVGPGGDHVQRLVRCSQRIVRAAWSGSRPVVAEASLGWRGAPDAAVLPAAAVIAAQADALAIMTPGAFVDGPRIVVLEPSVVAAIIDAAAQTLLVATPRPEIARRLSLGANAASALVSLVDDPTVASAYGGFAFDDLGAPAAPVTLVDRGHVAGVLGAGRARRPGHLGVAAPAPSHLVLAPGSGSLRSLFGDGLLLQGGGTVMIDPASDRIVVTAARARELAHGADTGRVWADVELVGSLGELLGSIDAVGADAESFAYRDGPDRDARWRSVSAPPVRTRGVVRARRLG
ncbi:MAG TPA: metallopeptidase TldD-related protein [Kofleriaceae bacterium]